MVMEGIVSEFGTSLTIRVHAAELAAPGVLSVYIGQASQVSIEGCPFDVE